MLTIPHRVGSGRPTTPAGHVNLAPALRARFGEHIAPDVAAVYAVDMGRKPILVTAFGNDAQTPLPGLLGLFDEARSRDCVLHGTEPGDLARWALASLTLETIRQDFPHLLAESAGDGCPAN